MGEYIKEVIRKTNIAKSYKGKDVVAGYDRSLPQGIWHNQRLTGKNIPKNEVNETITEKFYNKLRESSWAERFDLECSGVEFHWHHENYITNYVKLFELRNLS